MRGVPKDEALQKCSNRLRRARFINSDFANVLRHAKKGDLVYMTLLRGARTPDIPRVRSSTFTHKDIARLRSWMERLDAANINFVVSYAESDEADVLRKGFSYEVVSVRRHIAGFAAHRALTNELLISNI